MSHQDFIVNIYLVAEMCYTNNCVALNLPTDHVHAAVATLFSFSLW